MSAQQALALPLPAASNTVVINARCSLRVEADQRVIVGGGLPVHHYRAEDVAGAYAMVFMVESGFAQQMDVARAFGRSVRTVRRHQARYVQGGMPSTCSQLTSRSPKISTLTHPIGPLPTPGRGLEAPKADRAVTAEARQLVSQRRHSLDASGVRLGVPAGQRLPIETCAIVALKIGDQVPERVVRAYEWDDVVSECSALLGYVCIGDRPAIVLDAWLQELREREVDGVIAGSTPARMIFRMGERVRVAYGPLGTVEGLIEQVPDVKLEDIDADTRLKLTIDVFGWPTPAELAAWQVEKL